MGAIIPSRPPERSTSHPRVMASWKCRHKIPYQPVSSNGDPESATPALPNGTKTLRRAHVTRHKTYPTGVARYTRHTHAIILGASAKELFGTRNHRLAGRTARAHERKTDRVHTPRRGTKPHLTALGWRMETTGINVAGRGPTRQQRVLEGQFEATLILHCIPDQSLSVIIQTVVTDIECGQRAIDAEGVGYRFGSLRPDAT